MRYGVLIALALTFFLTGATCVPLIDLEAGGDGVEPGTELAVSVMKPATEREVPLGTVIEIEWTAANETENEAVATVLVRARATFAETILEGGLRLPEAGGTRSLAWDTTGFEGGEYTIAVRVDAGTLSEEATASARITINTPPSFSFTEPFEDTELAVQEDEDDPNDPNGDITPSDDGDDPNDPNSDTPSVTIRWTAFDPDGDGTAEIVLDPGPVHDTGNEIVIAERELPEEEGFESLVWEGNDTAGEPVEAGTYYLFARVSDGINEDQVVEGLGQIIVPEGPEEFELAITQPEEDTDFLTTDDPLTIEYTLDEDDDVLIDLEIDSDDNHGNGNEIPILLRRLIETGTNEDSFEWDGTDSDDVEVGDGIYKIILRVLRETGTAVVTSEGFVFRRSEEEQPLIALLSPSSDVTVDEGTSVSVTWRDDDPLGDEDAEESSKIRITIDDDELPDEAVETDEAEIEVLVDWDAAGDGVQDRLTIPYRDLDDLAPGRYYIFAYIDRDGADPIDHVSIAAGQIVIEDPDAGD